MQTCTNAVIDPVATGHNIRNLRQERGLSVKDLQHYFNFDEPRAIYKWQAGQSLPSIDNLYVLNALFDVPIDDIIIGVKRRINFIEPQDTSCGSISFCPLPNDHSPSIGQILPELFQQTCAIRFFTAYRTQNTCQVL